MQWFKGNYKKTLYCWHISKNIDIIPLDKFASIISTNTIIDVFDTILCIYVHFHDSVAPNSGSMYVLDHQFKGQIIKFYIWMMYNQKLVP